MFWVLGFGFRVEGVWLRVWVEGLAGKGLRLHEEHAALDLLHPEPLLPLLRHGAALLLDFLDLVGVAPLLRLQSCGFGFNVQSSGFGI